MTAMDRPDNGQDEGQVLVARCGNYREDLDQPCTGTIRYRWGMIQAACDTCGGYCGVAVADWLEVTSGRAGAGEQQRDEPLHEVECPSCGATIRARMADGPQPNGEVRQHRMDADCWCQPVQADNGAWDHNDGPTAPVFATPAPNA